MHGVAPDVSIKPVKIFGNNLSFASHDQLVDGINQGSGVAILAMNNSWSTPVNDTLMHQGTTYHYKRPFYNYMNNDTEYVYGYFDPLPDRPVIYRNNSMAKRNQNTLVLPIAMTG